MSRLTRSSLILLSLAALGMAAQAPDGETILKRVDDNMGSDNKIMTSEMIIHGRRGSRSIRARSWVSGRTKSFTEYLDPPREKGTKMLKLEDQLWTYSPASDRTILIAGHMLRQSVMGSDLSYEDMMEDPRLTVLYKATVAGEEQYEGRPCWVLDLASRGEEVAYFKRKIWVDKERYVVLREERFAKSGRAGDGYRRGSSSRMSSRRARGPNSSSRRSSSTPRSPTTSSPRRRCGSAS